MERIYLLYFLVLCFGSLSVYNFLDNLQSNANLEDLRTNQRDVGEFIRQKRHRQRRSAQDDDSWFVFNLKIKKLKKFVKTTANQTLQEEFKKILNELRKEIPKKCSCDHKPTNCQTELQGKSKKDDQNNKNEGSKSSKHVCLPGPRGPPGPIELTGKRGLGLEKPTLINSSLRMLAIENNDVTFECVFFGNPIPSVEWESNSFNVDKVCNTIDKEKSQITSRLTVSNVKWGNKGLVKCKARNMLGEVTANGGLKVHIAPVIYLQKKLLSVPRGINYQFPECKVRSYPKAKRTWRRLFWKLPEGRHSTNGGFLNISRVEYHDEGTFVCEAENYLGKAVEKVQLKTKSLEMHEKPLPNLRGLTEVNITCSAYGNPNEMSGQISRIDGFRQTEMETFINKTENLFSMRAVVRESGTFGCSIKFGEEEVKSFSSIIVTQPSFESCKKIKEKNSTAKSGSYMINLQRPTKVYCDMETDGGGWIRIGRVQTTTKKDVEDYNFDNILSTNLLDLKNAASQNFLLSGGAYPALQSYVKFHEFRVFCTKPYHGRKNHVSFDDQTTPQSKKIFDYLMGKYSRSEKTCNALKYMPDDNSILRSTSCSSSRIGTQSSVNARFYKFIWYLTDKAHINLDGNSFMYCDDYSSGTGYNNLGTWLFYVR